MAKIEDGVPRSSAGSPRDIAAAICARLGLPLTGEHGEDSREIGVIGEAIDDERERCARIADEWAKTEPITPGQMTAVIATVTSTTGAKIAAAIRSGQRSTERNQSPPHRNDS